MPDRPVQQSLFEDRRAAAIEARDQALDNVERGAPPVWLDQAEVIVRSLARSHEPFSTDDVWDYLAVPPEPRAMGAVINRLSRQGVIRKTGRYIQSSRRENHARPVCQWVGP